MAPPLTPVCHGPIAAAYNCLCRQASLAVGDHPAASFRLGLAAKFIGAMAILKAVEG
jgi:hypothetical protein